MPVQECRKKTTSTEFAKWAGKLSRKPNEFTPEHYYWAQIALWAAAGNVKNPKDLKLEDFLLKFKFSTGEKVSAAMPKAEFDQKVANSKSFWGAIAGVAIPTDKED